MGYSQVKQNMVLYENEIEQIKEFCADEVAEFGDQFRVLHEIYSMMGWYYPEECNTNYRDSWFHFRKLYRKKDVVEILNQKFGLEEHLLRAAKDAQIFLLQQLGYCLEVWYDPEPYFLEEHLECEKYQEIVEQMPSEKNHNWVSYIDSKTQENGELFTGACLMYFFKQINSSVLRKSLQMLIHSIKNLILDLRLGGVHIFRPEDNMYYLRRCVSVYNDMYQALEGTGLLFLIPVTEMILMYHGKGNILKYSGE